MRGLLVVVRTGYHEGRGWVSAHNTTADGLAGAQFAQPVVLYDSTLRKIIGTPGVRASVDDLLRVAEAIEAVGITEIFLNVSWWGDAEPDTAELALAKAVLSRSFAFKTTVFSDAFIPLATSATYDAAAGVQPRTVVETLAAIGASQITIAAGTPTTTDAHERQEEQVADLFGHARAAEIESSICLMDVGRASMPDLVRVAMHAAGLGAARVDMLDSAASLSPEGMKAFLTDFSRQFQSRIPITMHIHDDFGLATACALAAAYAGAHPDVSVNGISYRSGFAALEEVAVALELLYGVPTGLRLERLRALSGLVSDVAGLPVSPLKAVTGENAFVRHIMPWSVPIINDGADIFPPPGTSISPAMVGGRLHVVHDIHTSESTVRAKLTSMELDASASIVQEVRRQLLERLSEVQAYPFWVSDAELESICREALNRSEERP